MERRHWILIITAKTDSDQANLFHMQFNIFYTPNIFTHTTTIIWYYYENINIFIYTTRHNINVWNSWCVIEGKIRVETAWLLAFHAFGLSPRINRTTLVKKTFLHNYGSSHIWSGAVAISTSCVSNIFILFYEWIMIISLHV